MYNEQIPSYFLVCADAIYHHGIKGMKWGVRRFQNKDGSLTEQGKKRISKKYERTSEKVTRDLSKKYNKMYVNAYNKAADNMNRGGIEKFNTTQRKKYGEKFVERDGYVNDYKAAFDKEFTKYMNRSLNDFYQSNKNYQQAKNMVEQYGMTKWDDLAKDNEKSIKKLQRIAGKD